MPICLVRHSKCITALFVLLCALVATAPSSAEPSNEKRCLYVSSYHEGHSWSDAIEASIREKLAGHCELRKMDLDSERTPLPEAIFKATNSIIKAIDEWQPDVVITSDDNAARHLIAPHYRDDEIPFVFSGVDWTVEGYGFPYENVTGIVEVAPIKTLFREAAIITNHGRKTMFLGATVSHKAIYIGADIASEKKDFSRMKTIAAAYNVQLEAAYYASFSQWKKALLQIEEYDFAVIGNNSDTKDWDQDAAVASVLEIVTKPTFTTDISMMPYSAFGFTKLATEQGTWAANVALRILNGTTPREIPMASNKKWEFWVNETIIGQIRPPTNRRLLRKAKRLQIATIDE